MLEVMGNEGMGEGRVMKGWGGGMGGCCWCVLSFLKWRGCLGERGREWRFICEGGVFVCVVACFAIEEFANAIGGR